MAVTALNAVGGVNISFTLTDYTGRAVTSGLLVPAATTLANAQTFALAVAQALEALSDAQVTAVNIGTRYNPVGADPAVQGNYAEDKGTFGIRTAAGKIAKYTVPALSNTFLLGQSRDINIAAPQVEALTTLLIDGNGTVAAVDSNASDLSQVVWAKLRQRNELMAV